MTTEHAKAGSRLTYRMEVSERARLEWDDALEERVARASKGDRSAFTEVYKIMYPAIARYLYYKLGDTHDAEDVAGEVFLSAWRQLASYRGKYFPGWVFTIARNLAVGAIRKKPRARLVGLEAAKTLEMEGSDPSALAETGISHKHLYRALAALKEDQREIIVFKYLLGMTNAEVSNSLGKSENAVNAQQHRALKRLQRILTEEGFSYA